MRARVTGTLKSFWNENVTAMAIAGILAMMMLAGCVAGGMNPFAGTTTVSYEKTADGPRLSYTSSKEQNNLHAEGNVDTGAFNVTVDKAGAQDSAVAALLQAQTALLQSFQQIMQQIAPLIGQAAKTAAVSGS